MIAAVSDACAVDVSMSKAPPGASHSSAPDATRRCTAKPSAPPSSATIGSWSRASGGIIPMDPVGT